MNTWLWLLATLAALAGLATWIVLLVIALIWAGHHWGTPETSTSVAVLPSGELALGDDAYIPLVLACGHVVRGPADFEVNELGIAQAECPDGDGFQDFVIGRIQEEHHEP